MLILRLNSNKELSYTNTTSTYSNENNFDNIRIVASPIIDGKNIEDYKVELYIYNILSQEWNTFNDCIPCDFVLENNKYIFEIPVKSQYTTCPRLGFYCKFTKDGVVGKTNVVETPVLYHKDNMIDIGNSIEVFEKYKKDICSVNQEIKRRIWFKKNCPEWTTPRIYLFTNRDMTNSIAPVLGVFRDKEDIWNFDDSPYMIKDENEEDLYYYDIPVCQHRNIIFFCDLKDSGGFNYKTTDLVIPLGYLYNSLFYWQSPIGYNGIWADKETNSFKLFIQYGRCYEKAKDSYSLTVKIDDINASVYNLGTLGCGGSHMGYWYSYVDVPLTASNVYIHIKANYYSGNVPQIYELSKSFCLSELCYNFSGIYQYSSRDLCNYDVSLDEVFMFQTRYSATEYQLYRDAYKYFDIFNTQQSLNNLASEFRNFYKPDYSFTSRKFYSEDSEDDEIYTDIRLNCRSCKIGGIVICNFELCFTIDTNGDNQTPKTLSFTGMLPYAKSNSVYQPIISSFNIVRPSGAVQTQPQYFDCYKPVTSVTSSNSLALFSCDSTTTVNLILNGAYNADFEERSEGVYTGYAYANVIYNTN